MQVQDQQVSPGVLVGPVAEGQHGLLQEVGGDDLVSVVVVELAELAGDAFLYGKPLACRVAVEQEHLQEPAPEPRETQAQNGWSTHLWV